MSKKGRADIVMSHKKVTKVVWYIIMESGINNTMPMVSGVSAQRCQVP